MAEVVECFLLYAVHVSFRFVEVGDSGADEMERLIHGRERDGGDGTNASVVYMLVDGEVWVCASVEVWRMLVTGTWAVKHTN